jgi:transcription antitermination factor NusG
MLAEGHGEGICSRGGVWRVSCKSQGGAVLFPSIYEEREPRWYAVYTRHQHEKVVAGVLAHKGIEVFLPLYTERSRWADRMKVLQRPLFPCYVFLHTDLTHRLAILQTAGVHFLVGGSSGPTPIPKEEIGAIRHAIESRLLVEPYPFLSVGDWVRVKAGPLAGIEGILVRKKDAERLILSVEMLQKSVAVELDGYLVERIDRRNSSRNTPAVRASQTSTRMA